MEKLTIEKHLLSGYQYIIRLHKSERCEVWRCIRLSDNKKVVIKTLQKENTNTEISSEFWKVYNILKENKIEGTPRFLDAIDSSDYCSLVMEDIDGISLDQYIKSKNFKNYPRIDIVIPWFIEIAKIIASLHQNRIMHLDINPSNIIICQESERIQVIDFGISKIQSLSHNNEDIPERCIGTLPYISPEQSGRLGNSLDYRSDFYSLGVTFYELATGKMPFIAYDFSGWIYQHLAVHPMDPKNHNIDIPTILSNIINKLLEKKPENRYKSAKTLKNDLIEAKNQLVNFTEPSGYKIAEDDVPNLLYPSESIFNDSKKITHCIDFISDCAQQNHPGAIFIQSTFAIDTEMFIKDLARRLDFDTYHYSLVICSEHHREMPYFIVYKIIANYIAKLSRLELLDSLLKSSEQLVSYLELFRKNQPSLFSVLPIRQSNESKDSEISTDYIQEYIEWTLHFLAQTKVKWIVFIENMQWLDEDSTNLLSRKSFWDIKTHFALFFSFKTDAGVSFHFKELLAVTHRKTMIELENFSVHDITHFLSRLLYQTDESVAVLADFICRKTAGNPYVMNHTLADLYERKYIYFDDSQTMWQWNLKKIKEYPIRENMVEYVQDKVKDIDQWGKVIYLTIACYDEKINLDSLYSICKMNKSDLERAIKNLIDGQLIIKNFEISNILSGDNSIFLGLSNPKLKRYLKNFYSYFEIAATHHKIADNLFELYHRGRHIDIQFIVYHYNRCKSLLDQEKLKWLFSTNLQLGKQALSDHMYYSAGCHFVICERIIKSNKIDIEVDELISLKLGRTIYLVRQNKFKGAEDYTLAAIKLFASDTYRAELYFNLAQQMVLCEDYHLAYHYGSLTLKEIGFSDNQDQAVPAEVKKLERIARQIITKKNLFIEPIKNNSILFSVSELILNLPYNATESEKNRKWYLTTLVLEETKSQNFTTGTFSALIFLAFHMIKEGRQFNLARRIYDFCMNHLVEISTHNVPINSKLIYNSLFLNFSLWQKKPHLIGTKVQENLLLDKHSDHALNLDYLISSMQYINSCNELPSLLWKLNHSLNKLPYLKHDHLTYGWATTLQFIKCLLGQTDSPETFDDDQIKEVELIARYQKRLLGYAVGYFYALKSIHGVLQGVQPILLKQWVSQFESHSEDIQDFETFWTAKFFCMYFYFESLEANHLEIICDVTKKFLIYKEYFIELGKENPDRFAWLYYYMRAEFGSDHEDVPLQLYQLALKHLSPLKNTLIENFVKIRMAKRFKKHEYLDLYRFYMELAYTGFSGWGAKGIADTLLKENPCISVPSQAEVNNKQTSNHTFETNTSEHSIDIESVAKIVHSISQEVRYPELIKKIMSIVMENAGANLGWLILKDSLSSRLEIHAEAQSSDSVKLIDRKLALQDETICFKVVFDAFHKHKTIILSHAERFGDYTHEENVIRYHKKSILCIPIVHGNVIRGVFYLENTLMENVFLAKKMFVLNLIATQAAISIENSIIYSSLEDKIKIRTKELLEAQNQISESHKWKAIREMANGVAHEINNPLAIIEGHTRMIAYYCKPGKQQQLAKVDHSINSITNTTKRIAGIVSNLRLVSQKNLNSHFQKEDISQLINKTIETFGQAFFKSHKIEVYIEIPKGNFSIFCSSDQFCKALKEVLLNSIDAISDLEEKWIKIVAKPSRSIIAIQVIDSGRGIPKERVGKIFQPFITFKEVGKGQGLGLSTAKGIVEAHKGTITYDATNDYTCFVLSFPLEHSK